MARSTAHEKASPSVNTHCEQMSVDVKGDMMRSYAKFMLEPCESAQTDPYGILASGSRGSLRKRTFQMLSLRYWKVNDGKS
jgi:hypothetical protein